MVLYPPPLEITSPLQSPTPLGGRPSLHYFARQYLLQWFVFPICHTHVLALLSQYFKSVTCVHLVYKVSCPFFRPKMFSPGDRVWYHSCTVGAHVLATVVVPSPNGLQFYHIRYVCPLGVTQVNHESAQLSRIEAVVDASPKPPGSPDITPIVSQSQTPAQPTQPASLVLCLLASVEGTTVCLGIPLQPPPPPTGVDIIVTTLPRWGGY